MAPGFIFAEQVRGIVRSGKKEMEIAEGVRISSAAADLIKEHKIRIVTVAPDDPAAKKKKRRNRSYRHTFHRIDSFFCVDFAIPLYSRHHVRYN